MTRRQKTGPQAYKIWADNTEAYVAFEIENRKWKMGRPVDWSDPLGAGLKKGTVSVYPTLRGCERAVCLESRINKRKSA